ncbi:S-protein homolog 74-like [Mercurialis annua]|uniref:S-protein homolog 74-like n=1 Tax=Mercurialis annua TaxID=3986 RepID=UPI0024ACFAEA|nr:S-protein homolog 74-like [Mercurialis annua]
MTMIKILLFISAIGLSFFVTPNSCKRPFVVTITNRISTTNLFLHCASKNNKLGNHSLPYLSNFSFHFHMNFWRTTKFWCYMRPENQRHYANFDVFRYDDKIMNRCPGMPFCYWSATNTGVDATDINGKFMFAGSNWTSY